MGRPKGGKNKYWSKEEKLKLIKEHLDNNISTNEIFDLFSQNVGLLEYSKKEE